MIGGETPVPEGMDGVLMLGMTGGSEGMIDGETPVPVGMGGRGMPVPVGPGITGLPVGEEGQPPGGYGLLGLGWGW